jgi:ketosteroid isomerase-like protein
MAATGSAVEDLVRTIRAMDREFMDNVAAKNAAHVAAVYADDARILMPGQPVITGKAEILAQLPHHH